MVHELEIGLVDERRRRERSLPAARHESVVRHGAQLSIGDCGDRVERLWMGWIFHAARRRVGPEGPTYDDGRSHTTALFRPYLSEPLSASAAAARPMSRPASMSNR